MRTEAQGVSARKILENVRQVLVGSEGKVSVLMLLNLRKKHGTNRLLEGRAEAFGVHRVQLRVRAQHNQLSLQAGVVEKIGLLLKERIDLGVAEPEPYQRAKSIVDNLGTPFDALALGKGRPLFDRVSTTDLGAQEPFFFQFLIGLPHRMEGHVEPVAELPS